MRSEKRRSATTLYWTEQYGGNVRSTPLAGGPVTTLVTGLSTYADGIAVDATSIYWVTETIANVASIRRLAK